MENPGDAPATPVWEVTGPGRNFTAISALGETLRWDAALAEGEILTIDTRAGTVIDQDGTNRYAQLAPAPRFWAIPPGRTTAYVAMEETEPGLSRIVCRWHPRRWIVF